MMKTVLLILVALVVGAIFGVAFLAALAKFGFNVLKGIFNFSYELSGCIIRGIALLLFLGLLFYCMASCQGGN